MGLNFQSIQSINTRVITQDEFHTLPLEVLQHILQKAEADENWDLAIIIRDEISKKNK